LLCKYHSFIHALTAFKYELLTVYTCMETEMYLASVLSLILRSVTPFY